MIMRLELSVILTCSHKSLWIAGILISSGWINKVPQTWWFETSEKFILSQFVRPEFWNQRVSRVKLLESLKEIPFPVSLSFWWLLAFLGLWLHQSILCLHIYMAVSTSGCQMPLPTLLMTLVIGFRAHLNNPE